jgi:hypothetical protein
MRIEMALTSKLDASQRLAAKMQIHAELEHLRESCEFWNSLKWSVRMFEVVLSRTGLLLITTGIGGPDFDISSMDPFSNADKGSTDRSNVDYDPFIGFPGEELVDGDMLNDDFGFATGRNTEEWLQDLLGSRFSAN